MKIKIPHIQLRLTLKEVHLLEFIFVLPTEESPFLSSLYRFAL